MSSIHKAQDPIPRTHVNYIISDITGKLRIVYASPFNQKVLLTLRGRLGTSNCKRTWTLLPLVWLDFKMCDWTDCVNLSKKHPASYIGSALFWGGWGSLLKMWFTGYCSPPEWCRRETERLAGSQLLLWGAPAFTFTSDAVSWLPAHTLWPPGIPPGTTESSRPSTRSPGPPACIPSTLPHLTLGGCCEPMLWITYLYILHYICFSLIQGPYYLLLIQDSGDRN